MGDTAFGQGEVVGSRTVGTFLINGNEVGGVDHGVGVGIVAQHHSQVGRAGNPRIIAESTAEFIVVIVPKSGT